MAGTSAILRYLSDSSNYNIDDQNIDTPQKTKKRRLDHLTWEEKLQRKKLKNRVAAQTSRDRKKARLEQMEKAIKELFENNEMLLAECEKLKTDNDYLKMKNSDLEKRLKKQTCPNCNQNRSVECENVNKGSAVSKYLQPKGTITHSAAVLVKILMACLLYRTSLTNSTITRLISAHGNNLHKVFYKISPETWKLLLKRQIDRNQNLVSQIVLQKWWGRHQKNWNPMIQVNC